jgi:WD40-like Beta Propeller Repeat
LNRKVVLFVLVAVLLPSCGGVVNNPSPHVTSINPTSVNAGAPGFVLFVNGSGFAPQSAVLLNGVARASMFLSGNQISTMIFLSDIQFPGTITVQVGTPPPGGGTSNSETLTVNPVNSPVPVVNSISPTGAFAGGNNFAVTVNGTGFVSRSEVLANGNNRHTFFISSTQLQATILASDIASAGTVQIAVLNSPPGGGLSNSVPLSVTNPTPILAALAPSTTPAGGTNVVVTLSGAGFDMASVVNFNGAPKITTFLSNTQLTVTLSTSELAAAATVPVFVFNPAPGGGTSLTLPFSILPTSTGGGLPTLVNIATIGTQANSGLGNDATAGPSMDTAGQFVAFASVSTNLVSGDNNAAADIFLRRTCAGATGCTPATGLVSLSDTGAQANGPSAEPSLTSDAQFVAYTSIATNLVTGVTFTGSRQVFLSATCITGTNCSPATVLVSEGTDGMSPANADSFAPSVSPDGRYVAFVSTATNLIATPTGGAQEIFLRDTCKGITSGCTPTTFLVSTPDGTMPANGTSLEPAAAKKGLFVSFSSNSTALPNNPLGVQQIFVRSTCVNVTSGCTASTSLISSRDGTTAGDNPSSQSMLSEDGRFFTFSSTATNLISTPTGGIQEIFLRDTCTDAGGGCMPATTLVSVAPDGMTPGNALSEHPHLSSKGEFVAFASDATNLVATDTNSLEDVFVRDTCAGNTGTCTAKTALVSSASSGAQGNGASVNPAISGNGHIAAFISFANNLVSNDTNGFENVFLAASTF